MKHKKIQLLLESEIDKLSSNEKKKYILKLQEIIEELTKPSKTSKNSSKPPSSDNKPNQKIAEPKWGGKIGHKGFFFQELDNADTEVNIKTDNCPKCGKDLSNQPILDEHTHQTIGIEIRRVVTNYNREEKYCPCCQENVISPLPEKINTHYDESISAFVHYLNAYQHIPHQRIVEFLRDVVNLSISKGTVNNILQSEIPELEQFIENLIAQIPLSNIIGADETGFRILAKNYWLWVFQNSDITYYEFSNRSAKILEKIFGETFAGILVSDFYSSYYKLNCEKQKCNAHLLRDLTYIIEKEPQSAKYISNVIDLLMEAKKLKETVTDYSNDKYVEQVKVFDNRLEDICAIELEKEHQPDAFRIQKRLKRHQDEILTFLKYEDVPFDNNGSERAIRKAVIHRKICQCFRTKSGSEKYAKMASFIETKRKRGKKVYEAICNLF